MDVIKATVYYVENNENVESISAIDDFLIALNRLFDELLFEKFPNPSLMKYKPFSQLSNEVQKILLKKDIILKPREANPAINQKEFEYIIDYLDKANVKKAKLKKFKTSSIIIKLMLLYGFSDDVVIELKVGDYDFERRTLNIKYEHNGPKHIYTELPYRLSKEIEEYLQTRDTKKTDSLLISGGKNKNKIKSGYVKTVLDEIKLSYESAEKLKNSGKNQFTATGLQKYAIIQMILSGMNQSIIMDFTGQRDIIYNDCQSYVNSKKEINRNLYINHMIRGINTYELV